jgi:hypothetical protein
MTSDAEDRHPGGASTAASIHDFLENPQGTPAMAVQLLIIVLILLSVLLAAVEFLERDVMAQNYGLIYWANVVILAVFTVEYLLRVATAPRKLAYVAQPMNVIDFLAIFPNYLEIILTSSVDYTFMELRAIRLIRMLRAARIIRGLRLLRFVKTLKRVFQYDGTILQAIMPMILLCFVVKGLIWLLESHGMWFTSPGLGDLLTIIGFALGIILSQKIGVSYDKFIRVEEASVRIYGNLQTLRLILNDRKPGLGTKTCAEWAQAFLNILQDPSADGYALHSHTERLYRPIADIETAVPDQFWTIHSQLCCDASFCLNKKLRLTPKPYDLLLHQATVIYLMLIAVFIPGLTGMLSVLVATYILYGMYNLTQDLDSIVGGEYNLINIEIEELRYFASEGSAQPSGESFPPAGKTE